VVDFVYTNNFNRDYQLGGLEGKVWIRDDSLLLQPFKTYLNKWGKKKKGKVGYRLTKRETTYAAVDTYEKKIIYLNKAIAEEEKLLVAAYLFIVACYMQYNPPFVDMTPH
jgi:hypothetical protein